MSSILNITYDDWKIMSKPEDPSSGRPCTEIDTCTEFSLSINAN